jgi:acyl dehydratase
MGSPAKGFATRLIPGLRIAGFKNMSHMKPVPPGEGINVQSWNAPVGRSEALRGDACTER